MLVMAISLWFLYPIADFFGLHLCTIRDVFYNPHSEVIWGEINETLRLIAFVPIKNYIKSQKMFKKNFLKQKIEKIIKNMQKIN